MFYFVRALLALVVVRIHSEKIMADQVKDPEKTLRKSARPSNFNVENEFHPERFLRWTEICENAMSPRTFPTLDRDFLKR